MYDGDLMDGEMILGWLTSQDVFETKDEIEEVNRRMLEKLLDENEFVRGCLDDAEFLRLLTRDQTSTDTQDNDQPKFEYDDRVPKLEL